MLKTNTPSFLRQHIFTLILLCGVVVSTGCGTKMVNPVTGKTERLVMDENAEIAQGKEGHQQVLKEYGIYNNPSVQSYVNDLGQRLAKQSHRPQLPWQFTVLDTPEINAFALPGGYVYVTRGIMAYMDSEADLAGVIGHEIGHVTAKHGAQRATKSQAAGLGVLAASVLGAVLESKGMSGAGQMASQVSQNAAAGYIAKYGREQELQADNLGAEYLSRNRYNPKNMIDVIKVLEQQERFAIDQSKAADQKISTGSHWLSSHPSNAQRLQEISLLAKQYAQPPGNNYLDDGRERYLKMIQGMHFGDSREQGVVRGQSFYHEPLNFAFTVPKGWKIQNSPEQLLIVNSENSAGLLVQTVAKQLGVNHEDIIRQMLKPTKGQLQKTTINGLMASRFQGQAVNENGKAVPVQATIINSPTGLPLVLQLVASNAQAMASAQSGFASIETSFRALTQTDRNAAKPYAIKTLAYPRGGFSALAQQSALGASGEKQLRLLNGYYGGGEPTYGQVVKTVVVQP